METRHHTSRRRVLLGVVFAITLLGVSAVLWAWGILPFFAGRRLPVLLTIGGVVCAALLAVIIASWLLRGLDDGHWTVEETRAQVRTAKATFQATIREARAAGGEGVPEALVKDVLGEFSRLEAELADPNLEPSPDMLDAIVEQAGELRRTRANFMAPRAAILHAGKAALDDMREWGVPQASLQRMTAELVPLLASPQLADARAALKAMLELRDQWDPYATWYNTFMGRTAAALLAILVLAVASAGAAFREGHVITSFALAGIGGAALSVLSRLPPLAAYGEATQYLFRIVSRVGTGFAASLIGAGVLAMGVVTINLPAVGSFSKAVEACSVDLPRQPPTTPSATPAPPTDGGEGNSMPSQSTSPQPSGATGQAALAANPSAIADAARPCGTIHVLVLLGIAMILGFSERALATFEDRVFPAGTLVPVPVTKPDGTNGPSATEASLRTQAATEEAKKAADETLAAARDAASSAAVALGAAATVPASPEKELAQRAVQETARAVDEAQAASSQAVTLTQKAVDVAAALTPGSDKPDVAPDVDLEKTDDPSISDPGGLTIPSQASDTGAGVASGVADDGVEPKRS